MKLVSQLYVKLDEALAYHQTRIALQYFDEQQVWHTYSYQSIREQVKGAAWFLAEQGVHPGVRVGLIGRNDRHWLVAFLAVLSQGGTVVALDPLLQATEWHVLMEKSGAQVVLYSAYDLATKQACDQLIRRFKGRCIDIGQEQGWIRTARGVMADESLSELAQAGKPMAASIPLVVFTSGTAGDCKGVALSDTALCAAVEGAQAVISLHENRVLLTVLPFHHVFGIVATLLLPLLQGGTVTCLLFMGEKVWQQTLRQARPRALVGVPRVYEMCLKKIYHHIAQLKGISACYMKTIMAISLFLRRRCGLHLGRLFFFPIHRHFGGRVCFMVSGAAPLHEKHFFGLEAMGFKVIQGYGMSETAALISISPRNRRVAQCVGHPIKGMSVRLDHVDAQGQGEVCVKGPVLMQSYVNAPEATRAVFDDQGWFHTGDIGRFHPGSGQLQICGRIKEMLVLPTGKKISPFLVEAAYMPLSFVKYFVVLSIEDQEKVTVQAVVVLDKRELTQQGQTEAATRSQVLSSIKEKAVHMPDWWSFKRVHFLDTIPMTSTLKVKRRQLKAQIEIALQ